MTRRGYLDWLRGVAVLIMIEAHTLDSWTQLADRQRPAFGWALIAGGFGAPIFLFLAGVALALAAGSRLRRGRTQSEVTALALRRGLQIFAMAFLFRLQSWLISGGPPQTMLKVDILNVMGLSMVAGAVFWTLGRERWTRAALLAGAAAAAAMLTPIVREAAWLSPLPDPMEWYLRPSPGRTTFTLFPWAGFLFGGGAVGLWLDAARTDRQERTAMAALAVMGPALALAGYLAAFLPPIYASSNFWTSSPTFFFLRLGVVVTLLPLAYAWGKAWRGRSPLQEFGVASLFVYWIHVEMVYGVVSTALHKRLTLEQALVAFAAFSLFLFALVKLKDRLVRTPLSTSSLRSQPG